MNHPAVRIISQTVIMLAVVGLLLAACSSLVEPTNSCPDADYPLYCANNGGCCPNGYPVNCGGKCYQTDAAARRVCSARLDTCYRE